MVESLELCRLKGDEGGGARGFGPVGRLRKPVAKKGLGFRALRHSKQLGAGQVRSACFPKMKNKWKRSGNRNGNPIWKDTMRLKQPSLSRSSPTRILFTCSARRAIVSLTRPLHNPRDPCLSTWAQQSINNTCNHCAQTFVNITYIGLFGSLGYQLMNHDDSRPCKPKHIVHCRRRRSCCP